MDDSKIEALISKKLIEPIMAQFKTIYEDIANEYNIPLDELTVFLSERIGAPPVKKVNLAAIQTAKNNSKYLNLKTQKAIQQTVSNKKNFIFYEDLGVAVPKQNATEYEDIIKQLNAGDIPQDSISPMEKANKKPKKMDEVEKAGKKPKKMDEVEKAGKKPKKIVEVEKAGKKPKKIVEVEKADKQPKKMVEVEKADKKPKKTNVEKVDEEDKEIEVEKAGKKPKKTNVEKVDEEDKEIEVEKAGKKPKKTNVDEEDKEIEVEKAGTKTNMDEDEMDEMIKVVDDMNEKRLDYEDGKWIDKEMKKEYVKKGQEIEQIGEDDETEEEIEYVFTDGSCFNNGTDRSIGGFGIFFGKRDARNKSKKYKGTTTNNHMELLAIFECLKMLKKNRKYCIVSDSEYAINCITKWYKKWLGNGWKNNSNEDVANRELIQSILNKKKELNVSFMHTKSHQERPQNVDSFDYFLWYGNDAADKLAKNNLKMEQLKRNVD